MSKLYWIQAQRTSTSKSLNQNKIKIRLIFTNFQSLMVSSNIRFGDSGNSKNFNHRSLFRFKPYSPRKFHPQTFEYNDHSKSVKNVKNKGSLTSQCKGNWSQFHCRDRSIFFFFLIKVRRFCIEMIGTICESKTFQGD